MESKNPVASDARGVESQEAKCELIRQQILSVLGTPKDLQVVQVRELWAGRFRVNIIIGDSPQSSRVVESYYVCVDPESKVLSTVPRLQRRF
jgi:hypothetical protein